MRTPIIANDAQAKIIKSWINNAEPNEMSTGNFAFTLRGVKLTEEKEILGNEPLTIVGPFQVDV